MFALAPPVLGRGAVITATQGTPAGFEVDEFVIDEDVLHRPRPVVDELHQRWVRRRAFVVRLAVDAARLKAVAQQTETSEPWQLGDDFLFHGARLHFLVWNNNYDFRTGEPVWWWGRKAIAGGASPSDTADVVLGDGTRVFCDGGPAMPLPVEEAIVHYTSIENSQLTPLADGQTTAELADDQLEAVTHTGGAARIIAPAGSGKTRVLAERLRHVLDDWRLHPDSVCAVAYNTRAAGELSERTTGVRARIRTLNSLALAIVNGTGGFARSRLETRREMLSERDVRNILNQIVTVRRRTNTDPYAGWIEAFSAVRLGLREPSEVAEDWQDLDDFVECYDRYREYLGDHDVLDFDEQIYRAVEILLQDSDARTVAQRRCRMLLVDEFQDLTPAHVLMLRLLASPGLDVFGVGDDDQVIYGYAGAKPGYLVDFDDYFPGAAHHDLEVNYRCPPAVVTAASNSLSRNAVRVEKKIRASPRREPAGSDSTIRLVEQSRLARDACEAIAGWIDEGCDAGDIAVLSRVNVTLLSMQVLLGDKGIPHTRAVDAGVLERTGIRTALAYLRIANDADDISRNDVNETVRRPSRRIARNVVEMMTKRPRTSITSLLQLATVLTGNDSERVEEYAADLQLVRSAMGHGTERALVAIRDQVGLGETMETLDGSRSQVDRSTHGDDLAALIAVAHLHPDASTFESWLRRTLDQSSEDRGVELSTVHRVKGREWSRVVVFDASDDLMPHRLSDDIAEERRVFHVAITRCRDRVLVVGDKARPSRFIEEMRAPGSPGSPVENRRRRESRPDTTTVATPDQRLVVALKQWRATTAKSLKVPAFTVLHDAHLEGIASTDPRSLGELGRCKGIGGTKLDRWGDEILATLEQAR